MDLIYLDNQLNDIAVLQFYDLDYAYGSDENDFELKTSIQNDVLEIGMYFYIPNTGYAGIIDAKKVSTINNTISYTGRTLEGILNSAIVSPGNGAAYYVANGDANTILGNLITSCNLSTLFRASSLESVSITNYQMRYAKLYDSIIDMLKTVNYGLRINAAEGQNNKIIFELSAVPIADYSSDEEWTSDEIKVESQVIDNQVNHLICLGEGNLADRKVIHLFTDQAGNVQSYKTVENPMSDADYILDQSKKIMNGVSEVTEVLDYTSASAVYNYELLTAKPSDWASQELFYTNENDSWKQVVALSENHYQQIASRPDDWNSLFKNYYEVVDGAYSSISAVDSYVLLTTQPSDWETNYGSYFTRYSDGVTVTWPAVKAVTAERLVLQTMQPSDWATNCGNYRNADGSAVETIEYIGWIEGTNYYYDNSGVKHWKHAITLGANVKVYSDFRLDYARNATLPSAYNVTSFQQFLNDFGENAQYVTINGRMNEGYSVVDMVSNMRTANNILSGVNRAYKVYKNNPTRDNYNVYMQTIGLYESNMQDWLNSCDVFDIKVYYVLSGDNYFVVVAPNSIFKIGADLPIIASPPWYPSKYYTAVNYDVAPAWASNTYYNLEHVAPSFVNGKYFRLIVKSVPNDFVIGKYYRKLTDNYYKLVESGIQKLAEMRKSNTITAKLTAEKEYHIGDLVAVRETITGQSSIMRVSKKILKISNRRTQISYTLE